LARVLSAAGLIVLLAASGHAAIGDPLGAEFQVNTYSTGAQGQPAVAPDGAGGFVVVWHSDGSGGPGADTDSFSIQAKRFTSLGAPIGDQFQVNTYTVGPQREPSVAPDGAGGFVVVWQSAGSGGTDADFTSIQGQRFTAAGAPVGGEFQVNTYTTLGQVHPVVAADGTGGFVVVWESDGSAGSDGSAASVQAQRFTPTGAPNGGEFQVNTYTTDAQYDACVAAAAGGFVVVWASAAGTDPNLSGVVAQRFGPGGPIGGEFQVNSYTTGTQRYPAITGVAGGGFVVAWDSDASREDDRSDRSVQAQRFDAAGSPLGAQFQVNTYTTGAQEIPAVGQDGGDGFVVVWASAGAQGTDRIGSSVQARAFDGAGTPRGPDFQVNSYTTSNQNAYAVAADGSGGFVVLWDSLGSAGTDLEARSVQAQRFVGPNTPTTTTLSGPTTTTTTLPFGRQGLTGRAARLQSKSAAADARLKLVSKDPRLTLGRGNRSPDDPVQQGALLTLSSVPGGFASAHPLIGSWKYVGKVGRNKGYKWKSSSSAIRTVVVKRRKLVKIVGRGAALGFDLDTNPDPLRVGLQLGGHLYCFEFGGEKVTFKLNESFKAKRATPPATCP
jgi:hypothetical protein